MLKHALNFALAAILLLVPASASADWPEFRGPTGNGHVAEPANLPVQWSETRNITWKTPIPHRGWSTPVLMGGQIWLTTATVRGNDFFAVCVDAETGKVLFNERLFHCDEPEPLGNTVNCYGSCSPVIEKGRVYIHFGSYGTACLDTKTFKTLWQRTDLPCRHYRGPASSPIIFENLLVLSFDGVDQQYTAALDKQTGKTVWKTPRSTKWTDLDADGKPFREGDFRKAFSTPLIIEHEGKTQMLSLGAHCAFSYDPRTGREIWKTHHSEHSSAPRPVFGNGIAFVTTGLGRPKLWAVRVGGKGDVTDTHVVWKTDKGAPGMPSPILVDDLLYVVSDSGGLRCLEAATGVEVWATRLSGKYAASPIHAGGKIYFSSQQGKTTVLKAGREFKILAENRLDGGFMSSPAASGNVLYLRTKTHLYRIEKGAGVR